MKDRIAKILAEEGVTGAKFADEIGVQASSVSHILSGRNNPGTDFLIKILERYRGINSEWLLLGKGEMYKQNSKETNETNTTIPQPDLFNQQNILSVKPSEKSILSSINGRDELLSVEKIIIFYKNNTFKTYLPD